MPGKYRIIRAYPLDFADELIFTTEGYNAANYVAVGVSDPEEWGSWTDEQKVRIKFLSESDAPSVTAHMDCTVFNGAQDVIVSVNGVEVARVDGFTGGDLSFTFDNPGAGKAVVIQIELPGAVSPYKLGMSADKRKLGLGITKMRFVCDSGDSP